MHTVFLLIYLLIALWGGLAGFQLLTKEESNKYWYLAFLLQLCVLPSFYFLSYGVAELFLFGAAVTTFFSQSKVSNT